jgi:hypothetical protein
MAFKALISYVAFFFVLSLSASEPTKAQSDCTPPELESFLEASRDVLHNRGAYFPSPEAETLCFTEDGRRLKWIGIRWYGPEDGALFALGDNDARIAALPLGAVRKLRAGPWLFGGTKTVWVDYVAGRGTGVLSLKTALVTLSDDKIVVLWSHSILERNFVIPLAKGTEEEYTVIDNENGTITVSGTLKTFALRSDTGNDEGLLNIKQLEEEKFCWLELLGRFTQCRTK